MKYYQCLVSVLIVFSTACQTFSQTQHNKNYTLKIKTDKGVYRGRMTNINDSSIEITNSRSRTKMVFSARQINLIIVKKPFLTNTANTAAFGGLAGAVLVAAYYLKQYTTYGRRDPSDPAFGYALWTTTAFGTGLGLLYGSIESIFVHKKIRIYKALYMFENKKGKMKKYLYY